MAEVGINYKITADTGNIKGEIDGLKKSLADLDKTGDKAAESVEDVAEETAVLGKASTKTTQKLKSLDSEIKEVGKTSGTASKKTASLSGSMKASAASMTIALTATVAIGAAFMSAVNSTNALIDSTTRLSAQTGQTVNTVLALSSASRAAGLSGDAMTMALNGFAQRVKGANKEGSAAAKAFEDLGIKMKNASGETRSMDELFRSALVSIGNLENETERTAAAVEVFGVSGTKLLGVLGPGTATLDEWTARTGDLAGLIDDNTEANTEWSTASVDLENSLSELTATVGTDVMPLLTELATATGVVVGAVSLLWEAYDKLDPRLRGSIEMMGALNDAVGIGGGELTQYEKDMAGLSVGYGYLNEAGEEVVLTLAQYNKAIAKDKAAEAATKAKILAAELKAVNAESKKAEASKAMAATRALAAAQRESAAAAREQAAELAAANKEAAKAAQLAEDLNVALAKGGFAPEAVATGWMLAADEFNSYAEGEKVWIEESEGRQALLSDSQKENLAAQGQAIAEFASAAKEIYDGLSERRMENLNAEIDATQGAIDRDTAMWQKHGDDMTQSERNQLLARVSMNKEALKKQEADKKRAILKDFRVNKAAALVDVGIKTAQSVMAALTIPAPAGPILAIANAAAGIVNAGLIASQKPPSFRVGGVVPDSAPMLPGGNRDQRLIAAEPGELVLNQEQQAAIGGGGVTVLVDLGDSIERMEGRRLSRQASNSIAQNTEIGV